MRGLVRWRYTRPPVVPLVLAVALFMENMDSTVIATSLAAIADDIHSDATSLKLALTSYLVALAIFIPITGWMSDRYGARKVFQGALAVFVLGSIACAMSSTLPEFIVARFVQGMGGAMMSPLAKIVLVRATPRGALVSAMAWLTIPALVGPMLGPPLGGFLSTYLSWHWIFLVNVPIGIAGIWLTQKLLPEFERSARHMDFFGFVLVGTAFAGIVFGFSVISLPALPPVVGVATMLLGVAAGIGYYRHCRGVDYPLLDLRLFRFPLFRATVIGGSFFRIGFGATPLLLPLMLQIDFGMNPFEAGSLIFVGTFGSLAGKVVATRLFLNLGFRALLTACCFATSLTIMGQGLFVPTTPTAVMVGVLILHGFVSSTFFTGVNAFLVADIDDKDAGQATAMSAVIAQVFLALGIAIGGSVLDLGQAAHGGALQHLDFLLAFLVVGCATLIGTAWFFRLPADAGNAMSGHHLRAP